MNAEASLLDADGDGVVTLDDMMRAGEGTMFGSGFEATAVWPVPGYEQLNPRDFSRRQGDGRFGSPRAGGRTHEGVDIAAPVGAEVVAFDYGRVVGSVPSYSTTYGNQVVIDHGGGIYSQSAHLDTVLVTPGTMVRPGMRIGTIGRTGNVPALAMPHLHFEIRLGSPGPSAPVADPMLYIRRD